MNIDEFLAQSVNKELNSEELRTGIQRILKCEGVQVFITHNNATTYELWKPTQGNVSNFAFAESVDNFYISNDGQDCRGFRGPVTLRIRNLLTIPIQQTGVKIGYLCAYNKSEPFTEQDIGLICSALCLLQLLMHKDLLLAKLTATYSDENFISKDLFLANMSHEIRTPLNGVVGYNQLLLQTTLTTTQKNYLHNMNTCSVQLMKIINDVLDFSKLNSNKMTLHTDCFTIDNLFQILNQTVGQELVEKRQTLNVDVNKKLVPPYVILDQQKLLQILVNFVTNASKYSPINTQISVTVTAKPENHQLIFEIQDQGCGISEHDQCELFNSFVQLNKSIPKQGSGLGLAISKRLVELLHGTVGVQSVLGKGSTFFFTCKYQTGDTFETVIAEDVKLLHGKYVLLVDDVQVNRIQLAEILFEWKMHPIVCASALEALRMVMSNRYAFELALVDICMPTISGVELARQIKEDKPLFPLVALSSTVDEINTQDFDVYLTKPVNRIQLFNAVHSIVKNNTSHRAYIGDARENAVCKPTSPIKTFDTPISILVAEDISYNQTVLVEMLRTLGYVNITTASDGKETIQRLEAAQFDIILLDLRMPVLDGFGVLAYLQKTNSPINVVVVTASALDHDKRLCASMNVHYYISKPIQMKTLKEVLLKLVAERRSIVATETEFEA